jgi:hypothetical protein
MMKLPVLLLALLAASAPAHAQDVKQVECTADCPKAAASDAVRNLPASGGDQRIGDQPGAYLSAELGNGKIAGPGAVGFPYMRWRAVEVRAGRDLGAGGPDSPRIDFVYDNEGHPDNNHRDGYALQFTFVHSLGERLTAELSAGPYTSMNTTTINGVQLDQSRTGMLYSVALRYPLDAWAPGAHVRIAYNHASMRDTFHSDALLIGVGRHFSPTPPFPASDFGRRLWLGASFGRAFTARAGTEPANGETLQLKEYGGKWALSLTAINEGDDKAFVDRRGVAPQFWLVQPLTPAWTVEAGLGPYWARNRYEGNVTRRDGLITLQFERNLSERTKAFFAFHRVKTFTQMNDRDLFHLGVLASFGG